MTDLLIFGWEAENEARAQWGTYAKGNPRPTLCSLPALDRPFDLAAGFACLDGLTAIVLFFALRQGQLHLGMTAFRKVDAQRDEREALQLSFPDELVDLLAMQQQLPLAERIVIHQVAMRVRTDVAVLQKHLAVINRSITVLKVHPAFTQRLHLGPSQDDPGFELFFDEVVMVGLAVGGYHFGLIIFVVRFRHVISRMAISTTRILL